MLSLYCLAVLIHLAGTAMNLNRKPLDSVRCFHPEEAHERQRDDVLVEVCSPYNLAVLIANKLTAKSQVGVDYRGQNTVKFVQDEKYSAKSGDFLRFYAYLCHVIDDFACFDFAALR